MRNRNKISDCWCFKLHWSPLATTSWSSAASIPFSPPYKSTCWIEDNAWLLCLFTLTTSWVNLFKTALLSPLTTQPTWSVAVSLMWCKSDSRPYAQVLLYCVSKNYKFIAVQSFPGWTLPGGNSLNSNCLKKKGRKSRVLHCWSIIFNGCCTFTERWCGGKSKAQGKDFHCSYFNWCIIIRIFLLSVRSSAAEQEEAQKEIETIELVSICSFNRAQCFCFALLLPWSHNLSFVVITVMSRIWWCNFIAGYH